jgi:peptidoglycan/xylan/chitin deacetylase (PgdA/CDA1 family)
VKLPCATPAAWEGVVQYPWPDGNRCAVVLSFDVDAEAPFVFRNPGKAAEQLGDVEERRFGPRTGLPRILRLLDAYGLKASFYVPGYTLVHHTEAVRPIQEAGHELACHGDVHETLDALDEQQETQVLEDQLGLFEDLLGLRPVGYRSPSWELNVRTPTLLKRYGFFYDSSLMGDDIPYAVETPDGPLWEVPVQWMLDDAPLYRHVYSSTNGIADPDRVVRMWSREFKALYEENGCFTLTMHPWISGRAGRLDALKELIEYMRSFPGVWFATALEVARWAAEQQGTRVVAITGERVDAPVTRSR